MRKPLRGEPDAFRLLLLTIVGLLPVAITAALAPAWLALALLGVAIATPTGRLLAQRRRPQLRLKSAPAHIGAAAERRILVVASDTLTEKALAGELERIAAEPGVHVRMLTPALIGRRARWTCDTDRARVQARRRLDETLARLDNRIDVAAEVSDAEPLQAIEDELVTFPADELIISTRRERPWQGLEPRLAGLARERFALPVSHLVFGPELRSGQAPASTTVGASR